jgi:hypothetical protein
MSLNYDSNFTLLSFNTFYANYLSVKDYFAFYYLQLISYYNLMIFDNKLLF